MIPLAKRAMVSTRIHFAARFLTFSATIRMLHPRGLGDSCSPGRCFSWSMMVSSSSPRSWQRASGAPGPGKGRNGWQVSDIFCTKRGEMDGVHLLQFYRKLAKPSKEVTGRPQNQKSRFTGGVHSVAAHFWRLKGKWLGKLTKTIWTPLKEQLASWLTLEREQQIIF